MNKFYNIRSITTVLFLISNLSVSAQLTVDSTFSPTQLVQTLLGGGITTSNISYTGDTIHASGFFNEPGGSFGITSGIMLTSGTVATAPGPNIYYSAGLDNLYPGDQLLNQYTNGLDTTQDATILEFDFTSTSDSVEFNYVFSSEEYNEFVNLGFSDLFGFFISGPGIVGSQNIALVPSTTIPVAIDNINNGNWPGGTVSAGPCMNCQYYVDNTFGTVMEYDGYTTVLTAKAGVIPCETYHLKLVIADVGDGIYDSGVFIEGGSFKSTGVFQVAYNGGDAPGTLNLCPNTCATLTAPYMYSYNWNTGDTTQTIQACTSGVYYVTTTNGACVASSASVNVVPVSGPPAVTISNNNYVLSSSVTDTSYTYQWYLGAIPFPGATDPSLALTVNGCYYLVITDANGCNSISDTICDQTVGISELQSGYFSVRPNPSDGSFTLETPALYGAGEITITDISGKRVYQSAWDASTKSKEMDIKYLTNGIYFLQLKTDRSIHTERIIIR
jgi:hypothetical protein